MIIDLRPALRAETFFETFFGLTRDGKELLVDFTASEMSLVSLAEWFEWLFPDQIMVPASKTRDKFSTDGVIHQITLGDLIERVGLVKTTPALVGRDLPDDGPEGKATSGCCGS